MPLVIKPMHKLISEHKDVSKIVIQLSSIIATFKPDVNEVLERLVAKYEELWVKVVIILNSRHYV